MRTDPEFINNELNLATGQEAVRAGSEAEGQTPPARENPFARSGEGTQVASLFGEFARFANKQIGKATGGLTNPHTRKSLEAGRKQKPGALDSEDQDVLSQFMGQDGVLSPPENLPDAGEGLKKPVLEPSDIDTDAVQKRYEEGEVPEEKRTEYRNLNIERHHEGAEASTLQTVDNAQTAGDIAVLMDAVAEEIGKKHKVQSNKTIEERAADLGKVKDILKPVLSGEQMGLMDSTQLYATRSLLTTLGGDVADLANQIKGGNATPETLLTYQKRVKSLAALQTFLRGNVTETARALQQQNMIAKTLKGGSIGDIDELMNVAHMTPEQIQRHAQVMASRVEDADGDVIAAMEPNFWERMNSRIALAAEYWKASILSGVETHLVNLQGNGLYNIWENTIIRPNAAMVGKGLQYTRWGSETDRVRIGETMGAAVASYAGVRDGIEIMWRTLLKDESIFNTSGKGESQGLMHEAASKTNENSRGGKVARGTATALSMPFRFLQAEDDLFKSVAYRQETTAQALRVAYAKGLEGKAAYKRAAELVENPTAEIHQAADAYAKDLTYTNTQSPGLLGLMGQSMKKLTAAYPILQFVTPFINTPVNLMQRAIDMSVLSLASPKLHADVAAGGARRDVALAKMATGSAFTAAVYMYYSNGQITGNGPENFKQRAALEKTGWTANSIKVGDKYIPYRRTDPFAGAIAGLVDKMEAAQYSGDEADVSAYMSAAVFGIAGHMMDGTFLRGASDTFKIIDGGKSGANYMANLTTGFIPFSGTMRTTSKLIDPQPRQLLDDKEFQTGFLARSRQKWKQTIPGLSLSMAPARFWDGSVKVPDQGRAVYAMSPIKMTKDKGATPVDRAIIENGVSVPNPSPMVVVGRGHEAIHFSLLDLDNGAGLVYDKFFQRVGDRRKEALQQLVGEEDFKDLSPGPGGERKMEIQKALHKARVSGLNDFMENDLLPMYTKDPEGFNSIALSVGLDREDFHERILNMLAVKSAVGMLPDEEEEMLTHVRRGRGKLETPLPVPTDKVKQEKPFEVGF